MNNAFDKPYYLWLDEKGYLYARIKQDSLDSEVAAKEARQLIDNIIKLCNGKPYPFVLDLRSAVGNIMVETGKILSTSNELQGLCLAEAFVVNSLGTRLLVNFYKRIYQPSYPSQIFTDISQARNWAMSFIPSSQT